MFNTVGDNDINGSLRNDDDGGQANDKINEDI